MVEQRISSNRCPWLWALGALLVVAAGFAGLDRWFYEHVSLVLETPTYGDLDFYTRTWPFWWLCRGLAAHVYGLLTILVVLLVLGPKPRRFIIVGAVAVAVAALVGNVAQAAIGRLRPNQAAGHLAFARPFSQLWTKQNVCFPSGEAATAFALACVLGRLYPRGKPVFYLVAGLAAASRLANGAHYLSDVAAGALLGSAVAAGVLRLAARGDSTPGMPKLPRAPGPT